MKIFHHYNSKNARRNLRALAYILNVHTILLATVGCLAVYACMLIGLSYNLDFSMVAMGVTFPLTFSIQQAFNRRERALAMMAELKATLFALFWQHRDWAQGPGYPDAVLGNNSHAWAREVAAVLREFIQHLQLYLTSSGGYESITEERLTAKPRASLRLMFADMDIRDCDLRQSLVRRASAAQPGSGGGGGGRRHMLDAYRCLSKLSVMNEHLTFKAQYLRGGEGGLSRTAQYLRYLVAQADALAKIKEYRTPVMLRHACALLVHLGAIFLAPYFVHIGVCDARGDGSPGGALHGCPAPYVASCVYVVIAQLLLNVQAGIEMPFDLSSVDDVLVNSLGSEFDEIVGQAPVDDVYDSGDCFATVRAKYNQQPQPQQVSWGPPPPPLQPPQQQLQ